MPSIDEMLRTFANTLAPNERAAVENARGDDDAKEDVFRRHWSLKEALVKAMGVGLAMELNRADFACEGEDGSDRSGTPSRSPGGVETATLRLLAMAPSASDRAASLLRDVAPAAAAVNVT